MRRSGLKLAVAAGLVFSMAAPAMAQNVEGVLVDHACYLTRNPDQVKGQDHTNCARACAQKGHRLAVVTKDGDVYMVSGALAANNNSALVPLLNRQVRLIGEVRQENLDLVNVSEAEKLDNRKNASRDGEVVTGDSRKGDSREGDGQSGVVMVIDALRIIDLTTTVPVPVLPGGTR